jgi:peptide/nickel transport system permease protein
VLPALTLVGAFAAIVARMTASSVREVAAQDWVRTARSIGLSRRRVFLEDMLRNAVNPVITVVGLEVGGLLGGTVLVERIFNWPGVGSLLVEAISHRDYPVVQGVVIVISAIFIVINILVDVTYGLLDPRVRK